ncbi:MAG TPA: MoxR family ATPase, partial [Ilumatobacteraceae bacterium]
RDRFLMKVLVEYPTRAQEAEIVRRMSVDPPRANRLLDPDALSDLQRRADEVFVHDAVLDYAVRLVLATRSPAEHGLADLAPLIAHGASPRATLGLIAAGRGLALLRGRRYALPRDVYDVARDVLRHRVLLTYEALADSITAESVVERIVSTVLAPRVTPTQDGVTYDFAAPGALAVAS